MPGTPESELSQLAFVCLIGAATMLLSAGLRRLVGSAARDRGPVAGRFESPRIYFAGMLVCGAVAIMSMVDGRPLFAGVFLLFATAHLIRLLFHRRGWRG